MLSPSSSLLLLAKTITHAAARSLCNSWASCSLCYPQKQNVTIWDFVCPADHHFPAYVHGFDLRSAFINYVECHNKTHSLMLSLTSKFLQQTYLYSKLCSYYSLFHSLTSKLCNKSAVTHLHSWASSLAAKSRRAQWLSMSGRRHNCRLIIQLNSAGINSWSCQCTHNSISTINL